MDEQVDLFQNRIKELFIPIYDPESEIEIDENIDVDVFRSGLRSR
jgi:hypothetical protein